MNEFGCQASRLNTQKLWVEVGLHLSTCTISTPVHCFKGMNFVFIIYALSAWGWRALWMKSNRHEAGKLRNRNSYYIPPIWLAITRPLVSNTGLVAYLYKFTSGETSSHLRRSGLASAKMMDAKKNIVTHAMNYIIQLIFLTIKDRWGKKREEEWKTIFKGFICSTVERKRRRSSRPTSHPVSPPVR